MANLRKLVIVATSECIISEKQTDMKSLSLYSISIAVKDTAQTRPGYALSSKTTHSQSHI